MEQILANIGTFLLQVVGLIAGTYVFYIIYFKSNTNIDDEDLDRVIKGGDKG
jgi:hypothetical protein